MKFLQSRIRIDTLITDIPFHIMYPAFAVLGIPLLANPVCTASAFEGIGFIYFGPKAEGRPDCNILVVLFYCKYQKMI